MKGSGGKLQQLILRHAFVPAALELLKDPTQSGTNVARWIEYNWSMEWQKNVSRLHTFIKDVRPASLRFKFPGPA